MSLTVTARGRFQPTLPARGATQKRSCKRKRSGNFNPRSPHGERHASTLGVILALYDFNPRSPHGERLFPPERNKEDAYFNPRSPHGERRKSFSTWKAPPHFNPRSPHGERRAPASGRGRRCSGISTHAPRTGSDVEIASQRSLILCYFNPRSPHGERLQHRDYMMHPRHFNPRSPHGERHGLIARGGAEDGDFNPRSPHGERQIFET